MRMQHARNSPGTVAGQPLEEVSCFIYIGSMVDTQSGIDADIRTSTNCLPDSQESLELQKIEKSTKLRIFNINVKSVLLYGPETWIMT